MVEISKMGQSGSERVVEIRGSLYYRVVVGSLLVTIISNKNRSAEIADSSLYRVVLIVDISERDCVDC